MKSEGEGKSDGEGEVWKTKKGESESNFNLGHKLLYILTGMLASTVPIVLFSRPMSMYLLLHPSPPSLVSINFSPSDPERLKEEEIELEKKMPLVTFEGNLMLDAEAKGDEANNFAEVKREDASVNTVEQKTFMDRKTMLTSPLNAAAIASLGVLTGVLSGEYFLYFTIHHNLHSVLILISILGAFGVGGGFIMVPLISAFSGDHQLALGKFKHFHKYFEGLRED